MKLERLSHVRSAGVWKKGCFAARLERTDAGVRFAYEPSYTGPAIAQSLPLGQEPIELRGGALPAFFSGLLPEGRRLTALRRAAKTSAEDELTLLLGVGSDLIGDVQVLPEGEGPAEAQAELLAAAGPPIEGELFDELLARAFGRTLVDRSGIPGVQDKVSGRMIALPLQGPACSYLLKLDPPEFSHLVENEAFFLQAARDAGLEVTEATLVRDASGRPGLLVKRFDREFAADEGSMLSHAQEDACQVLSRYPADKYRVSSEELILALANGCGAPIVAARTLLRQIAFAFLTCNGDAHAKNFSILERGGEFRVSPAYDLPSTHVYGDTSMALPIQGRSREDIGRKDFIACGEHCGVPRKATERVLDELLQAAPAWLDRLDELPFDARARVKLRRSCEYRAERLRS